MKPLSQYADDLRELTLEQFCERQPNPVLLHTSSSGPLKPVQLGAKLTIDRLVLEKPVPRPENPVPDGDQYSVFEISTTPEAPRATVGCTPDADVRVDDMSVSKRHALIMQREDGYAVADDDSSAGTQVNGELLSPGLWTPLTAGDRLTLGFVDLKFYPPAEFYVFTRVLFGLE